MADPAPGAAPGLGCQTPTPTGPATLRCREELALAIRATPHAAKRQRVASALAEARCGLGVTAVLHDLVTVLRGWSPVVDASPEVRCTAQRLVDALGGTAVPAPAHYGAALMLATKLVSTQYRLLPASWVAHALGIAARDVLDAELQLCRAADWRLQRFCA